MPPSASNSPRLLEIVSRWNGVIQDVRHLRSDHGPVTIGTTPGWRWSVLGAEMATLPGRLPRALAWVLPGFSQVDATLTEDIHLDPALMGGTRHVLASPSTEGWEVDQPEGWTSKGELATGLFLRRGSHELALRIVDRERRVVRESEPLEGPWVAAMSAAALLGLSLTGWVALVPQSPETMAQEVPDHVVQALITLPPPEPDPVPVASPKQKTEAEKPQSTPEPRGKRGKRSGDRERARGARKRHQDRQVAERSGVLGALDRLGEASGVFGDGNLSSGVRQGVGGLRGPEGVQIGTGRGPRGDGFGGGGPVEGIGDLGTQGIGGGDRDYGDAGDCLGPNCKEEGALTNPQDAVIIGTLPADEIQRVILDHLPQIRYCYQRRLQQSPDLSGKVTAKFTIASDGTVSSSGIKTSTLDDRSVEHCVGERIRRMVFPRPARGIVIVSYPFLFTPG